MLAVVGVMQREKIKKYDHTLTLAARVGPVFIIIDVPHVCHCHHPFVCHHPLHCHPPCSLLLPAFTIIACVCHLVFIIIPCVCHPVVHCPHHLLSQLFVFVLSFDIHHSTVISTSISPSEQQLTGRVVALCDVAPIGTL